MDQRLRNYITRRVSSLQALVDKKKEEKMSVRTTLVRKLAFEIGELEAKIEELLILEKNMQELIYKPMMDQADVKILVPNPRKKVEFGTNLMNMNREIEKKLLFPPDLSNPTGQEL
jgi:hypothetical protein